MEKRDSLIKCGYECGFAPKKFDSRIEDISSFLMATDLESKPFYIQANLKRIINLTEAFYSQCFTSLHSVLSLDKTDSSLYPSLQSQNNIPPQSFVVREYSPFRIPIILKNGYTFSSSMVLHGFKCPREELGGLNPVVVSQINLKKPFTDFSFICYAHEIMHSQIDTLYGAVKDYHNIEVLPIFIEKLMAYALDLDVFHEIEKERLYFLCVSIRNMFDDKTDNTSFKYYYSTLKAEALFDMFINSSENDRKVIMDYIQMIINGEITLEEVLDGFGITIESSLNLNAIKRNLSR